MTNLSATRNEPTRAAITAIAVTRARRIGASSVNYVQSIRTTLPKTFRLRALRSPCRDTGGDMDHVQQNVGFVVPRNAKRMALPHDPSLAELRSVPARSRTVFLPTA